MRSVFGERRQVNGRTMLMQAIATSHAQLLEAVSRQLTAMLVEAVTYLLGRGVYERRQTASWEEQSGRCHRCQSQAVGRMVRNGYRHRSLLTPLGWVEFWLPRGRCQCGGSVEMTFEGLVHPYQRLSDLVDEQVCRWYRQGLSLRQLQAELAHSYLGPLALSTLLQRLHQLVPTCLPANVPPIIQVDAIWVIQVLPNGRSFTDRKGRRRLGKSRRKRPLFIALGVWPETDQAQVLDWMLGESEEGEAWLTFLTRLEAAGLRGEQGLQLLIHALARQVAYGKQGVLTAWDLEGQRNTSSCLTLIMACIIYWQAKEISRVIQEGDLEETGVDFNLLEHLSPIGWENIILYGEYVLNRSSVQP